MSHILVLNFSNMGDILMTIPVIDSFAQQHPDVRLTVVSRAGAKPVFALLPANVSFVIADLNGEHHGWKGMNLLGRRLLALQPTHIADLHDSLKTKYLRMRFALAGQNVKKIRKERHTRKRLLQMDTKATQTCFIEKYADVFRRLGYKDFHPHFKSIFSVGGANLATILPKFDASLYQKRNWVAVAPFANHDEQIFSLGLMEEFIGQLSARTDVNIFLLGGQKESSTLAAWAERYPCVEVMSDQLHGLIEKAALISHCSVMVCVDPTDIHLASLVAVPVICIRKDTHLTDGSQSFSILQPKEIMTRIDQYLH
ncbi:MAG: glycosyltransferase family 9 protein [Bacteroidaceae bacterium]|nr:glycosyltransferase family 9 protein [Bacteroidaceae bacterium]